MLYLLLGLLALALWLTAARAFTQANPAVMAREMRRGLGYLCLLVGTLLIVRGGWALGASLALAGGFLLRGQWPFSGSAPRGTTAKERNTSRVMTEHLEVELDHETGAMRGRVRKGIFQGRRFDSLRPADLALLWQDCRFNDPQSAQIVEAYLDRMHPTWREDLARGEREMASGPNGRMTREEALNILGLKAGAGEEDIRRSHRELMMKLHPDRGGSTYLAAKINEAKDVLLERG